MSTGKINKITKYGLLVCLTVLAIISVFKGIVNGLDGQRIDFLHKEFRQILFNHDCSQIVQFPSTMLFIYPLGLLSYRAAQIVWVILQFVFSIVIFYFTKKVFFDSWKKEDYLYLILLTVAGAPWRTNLSNLQYSLCAFAFFMVGLWLIEVDKEIWAGIAFSMSFFKVQLIVPLLAVLIYKRKWKPFVILIITQLFSFIFSLYWFKDFYAITFSKLDAIFAFNDGASKFIDFSVIFDNKVIQYGMTLSVIVVILYVSWKLKQIERSAEPRIYTLYFVWLLLWALVMFYHRIYDYFMCSISISYLVDEWKEKRDKWTDLLLVCAILTVTAMNFGVTVNEILAIRSLRFLYYALLVGVTIKIFRVIRDGVSH